MPTMPRSMQWFWNRRLHLLPREALLKTGELDQADWNYRPLLGSIERARFRLVASLLDGSHYPRLLEAGYGSGIFLPHLRRHCDELWGIDVHPHPEQVETVLSGHGIEAHLHSGSLAALPFDDGTFDCIVCVSCVEFIDDLDAACQEMKRVLSKQGRVIVVTPGQSGLLDRGLELITGRSAETDFGERRRLVSKRLMQNFELRARKTFLPGVLDRLFPTLYTAYLLASRA